MQVGPPRSRGRDLIFALAAGVTAGVWAVEATWLWSPHLIDRILAALLYSVVAANVLFAVGLLRGARSFYLGVLVVVLNVLCIGGFVFMIRVFSVYVHGEAVSHPR